MPDEEKMKKFAEEHGGWKMPDINNVEDPDDPWKKIEEHYDGKFVPKWVDNTDKPVKPKRKSYT